MGIDNNATMARAIVRPAINVNDGTDYSKYSTGKYETEVLRRDTVELSDRSLHNVASCVGLQGTGDAFSTPFTYRFLEKYVPSLLRSITNVHVKGLNNVPRNGAAIFAGNHLGNLDPFIKILCAQRPIHFLAKEGHFQKQPNRFVMISTGQIETFRETGGGEALARAVDVLESGGCLGVFPEGTRSRRVEAPFLQNGKTGVARLAARFPSIPIVPLTMSVGARNFMPPGTMIPILWKRIDVIIDRPISFGEWLASDYGGGLDDEGVNALIRMDENSRGEFMRSLYRKFTDQLIETLRFRGAP